MTKLGIIRGTVQTIEDMLQVEVLSLEDRQQIYQLVDGFIFSTIGFETLIAPETLTAKESVEAIKAMTEVAARTQRVLDPLECEIIRSNAKSLLLALGFK